MADDVWVWCEKNQSFGATVTVKIKYTDFQIITRSRTVTAPIATHDRLRDISLSLVRSVYPVSKGIRLVGVAVSKFGSDADGQLDLAFDAKPD